MKTLDFNNILEELMLLESEKSMIIKVDKSICAQLELMAYKKPALEELFASGIRGELIDSSYERLTDIIENYTATNMLLDSIMAKVLLETLGEEAFIYLRNPMNNFTYYLNFTLEALIISKTINNCKSCH